MTPDDTRWHALRAAELRREYGSDRYPCEIVEPEIPLGLFWRIAEWWRRWTA